jgi:hypothetical protein
MLGPRVGKIAPRMAEESTVKGDKTLQAQNPDQVSKSVPGQGLGDFA